MTTEEDVKDKVDDEGEAGEREGDREGDAIVKADDAGGDDAGPDDAGRDGAGAGENDGNDDVVVPTQLGTKRFVYAAYFAAGIAMAFLISRFADLAWERLALYKPEFGEPKEEIVMTVSALLGAAIAVYYYRDPKTRTLIDEVASELSQVTWPDRPTVMTSTVVVIVTTLVATSFFALMDRFWGFVTNLVYGAA